MPRHKLPLSLLLFLLVTCRDSSAPPTETKPPNTQSLSVLTQHNDNSRSGLNANDVSKELWNTQQNSRDNAGFYAKFSAPTIANGQVYLPTFSNRVVAYGLR